MMIRRITFEVRTLIALALLIMMMFIVIYLILSPGAPPPLSQKPSFGRSLTDYFSKHFDWPGPDYEPAKTGIEGSVIVYNRVPKTGSTSFVNLMYSLCATNRVHVVHFNITKNSHVLNLPNQFKLVSNISNWEKIKPVMYHGHLAFLDFARLGSPVKPLYINIVRKPLDRLISYYYFLRFGDDFRPHLKRKRMHNKAVQMQTFDDCVISQGRDCSPSHLWLQIPFFCGHDAYCWVPGNKDALQQAKRNLQQNYFLVGVTEQMLDFLRVLEKTIPRFFNGSTNRYQTNKKKAHLRKTANKKPPSQETIDYFHKSPIWKMENEFYEFALSNFETVRDRVFTINGDQEEDATPKWIKQSFHYEKIRPRPSGDTNTNSKQNVTLSKM